MAQIQAKHYRKGRIKPLRVVVIHTMEAPEGPRTAENVARYFQRGTVKASAHVCVDQDSLVTCVDEGDTAYAAPGANADGYQVELAGRAAQSQADWSDQASTSMLQIAARDVARICVKYRIPIVHLTVADLKAGKRGIVGHYDVTRAYRQSSHTDPGANFPWSHFLEQVRIHAGERPGPTKETDDVAQQMPVLKAGSAGGHVKVAQALLRTAYGRLAQEDLDAEWGRFGPNTESAVKDFQDTLQIPVTGTIDARTWAALLGLRA